jgi:hypothetical protein
MAMVLPDILDLDTDQVSQESGALHVPISVSDAGDQAKFKRYIHWLELYNSRVDKMSWFAAG